MCTITRGYQLLVDLVRIADKSAWLEVEIVGAAKDLDKAVDYLKSRGVTVEKLR